MNEHDTVTITVPSCGLHGRRKIFTDQSEITSENIIEVLGKAYAIHCLNRKEIRYLYDYYRGKQDILSKKSIARPQINNKVTINRANEIVTFKTAYLLGEPIQYVSNGGDDGVSLNVNRLNEFMRSEDKDSKDKEVCDWMHICGVGVRMILPDPVGEKEGSPVCIYTLNPAESFVIYSSGIGELPLAGVIRQKDKDGQWMSCIYTATKYYEIKNEQIIKNEYHTLGRIPIIEYLNNDARMGAFEVVLPVLNTLNVIESNRIDNVEDFVNAFDVFQNCELAPGQYEALSKGGMAIQIKGVQGMEAKVYRISSEMSQTGAQTIVDDLNQVYLTVCGMPNRNGGSSTSDTGQAVLYRDGFEAAESRAKDSEKTWKRSEREFLKLVIRICRDTANLNLNISDVKIAFTRKNFANLQSKVQVLAEMLNNEKIHPKLAFEHCGIFTDAEEAYRMSMEWYEEHKTAQPVSTESILV